MINPGLPAAQFDTFDSDEHADDPIEDEHHATFASTGYAYARQLFQNLFSKPISTVGQFLCQSNPDHAARFLAWFRIMRLDHVKSDGSAPCP